MAVKFILIYRSGKETEITHRPQNTDPLPGPINIRQEFEEYLKTQKQRHFVFKFRDQPASVHLPGLNTSLTIDFREVISIREVDIA